MLLPLLLIFIAPFLIYFGMEEAEANILLLLGVASLVLGFLLVWWPKGRPRRREQRRGGAKKRMVVVDGSNVMHWREGRPSFTALEEVIRSLKGQGFEIGVVFDANAGYLLSGRYMNEHAFAKRLKLAQQNVWVVHKGEPADPIILGFARQLGARVVSNDRYRDWSAEFPEVHRPGWRISGGYSGKTLHLTTTGETARQRAA